MTDEVPGDQEVRREPHLADGCEFVGKTFDNPIIQPIAPPRPSPLEGQVLKVGVSAIKPIGNWEVRQLWVSELNLHVTPLSDPEGVVARRWDVAKQMPHLSGGLQVVLLPGEAKPVGVAHQRTRLHAEQCVVCLGVITVRVVAVVGSQQRCTQVGGQTLKHRVGSVLFGHALILKFDKQVVLAEDLLEAGRFQAGVVVVVAHEGLQHVAPEAACGGNQALGMIRQHVPVHPGLVVVALQKRTAGHLNEVPVPGVILGQQGEVVHEFAAAVGLATGIVYPPPPRRPLEPGVVSHVGLSAQDGLNPSFTTRPVEIQDPVHVSVVGDS